MTFQYGPLLAGNRVPDPHSLIGASAGDQLSLCHGDWAYAPDPALMAFQNGSLVAGRRVPYPDGVVAAGAGQQLLPGYSYRARTGHRTLVACHSPRVVRPGLGPPAYPRGSGGGGGKASTQVLYDLRDAKQGGTLTAVRG